MSKSVGFEEENTYIDSKVVAHNRKPLNEVLEGIAIKSGTWTPKLIEIENNIPITTELTALHANYFKLGKLVYVDFFVRGYIRSLTSKNNYAGIMGLPFNAKSHSHSGFGQMALSIGVLYQATEWQGDDTFCIVPSTNIIRIQGGGGSSAHKWKVTPSNVPYMEIAGGGFYLTD